ncbi:hypothetical protein V2J09_004770 [Rumex salicifolius]
MKRGESYGGGQSSLGYLFGSPNEQSNPNNQPHPSHSPLDPPYGTDTTTDHTQNPKDDLSQSPDPTQSDPNPKDPKTAQRGNSLGSFIMGRPSTKVKSVPGGSSSLGYLFGDNVRYVHRNL